MIIRAPWFYGPNQPPRQSLFFRMIRDGKGPIVGDGDNRRSMAYVDNLCQGLMLAAATEAANGRTYWIADERPYTMNEIIDTVERLLEREFGQKCAHKRMRLPGLASEVAWVADKTLQGARPVPPEDPRAVGDEQDHRLLRREGQGRARLPARRGPGGRHAPQPQVGVAEAGWPRLSAMRDLPETPAGQVLSETADHGPTELPAGVVRGFDRTEVWIFDLDNTLYPADTRIFAQVDQKMGEFIARYLGVPFAYARHLQKSYYRQFGTTLTGLMKVHRMDPKAFLDYVHDLDLSGLAEHRGWRRPSSGCPGAS